MDDVVHVHLYHAPSRLPRLTTKLSENKIINNLIIPKYSEYDEWLYTQHSNQNNEIWLKKGNQPEHNYSIYDFNKKNNDTITNTMKSLSNNHSVIKNESSILSNTTNKSKYFNSNFLTTSNDDINSSNNIINNNIATMLKPLPEIINIEVSMLDFFINSSTLNEKSNSLLKQISSNITLKDLKKIIIKDIIINIERTLDMKPLDNPTHNIISLLDEIDLLLQAYYPTTQNWKHIRNETDWLTTKMIAQDDLNNNIIKLAYTIEIESKNKLIKYIHKYSNLQKKEQLLHTIPHVALKILTNSLDHSNNNNKMKKIISIPSQNNKSNSNYNHSSSIDIDIDKNINNISKEMLYNLYSPTNSRIITNNHNNIIESYRNSLSANSNSSDTYLGSPTNSDSDSLLSFISLQNPKPNVFNTIKSTNNINNNNNNSNNSYKTLNTIKNIKSDTNLLKNNSTISNINPLMSISNYNINNNHKSLLYPKKKESLVRIYEKLNKSIPQQIEYAHILEQKLLKTRW